MIQSFLGGGGELYSALHFVGFAQVTEFFIITHCVYNVAVRTKI